jgi:predicted glycosyltransferase
MTASPGRSRRPDHGPAGRYVFFSHDGYGVGHFRRNALIAHEILAQDPTAEVTLVTGVCRLPAWTIDPRICVVPVPPLVKGPDGVYGNDTLSFEQTVARRSQAFAGVLARVEPHVVVVDRHPFGISGELRAALVAQRRRGASVVLGLRDILDDPATVRREMAGRGWDDVAEIFDEILVYGAADFCDHQREYGLPFDRPTYCGWVVETPPATRRSPRSVTVAAGGGGDGGRVFRLGLEVLEACPGWRGVLAAGPYADVEDLSEVVSQSSAAGRTRLIDDAAGCVGLFARSSAAIQMAGYNSSFEALAAGLRPILVPRWQPRREQLIRAELLAERGLADVVAPGDRPEAVARLLDTNRTQSVISVRKAGIDLDGAFAAASRLRHHCRAPKAA